MIRNNKYLFPICAILALCAVSIPASLRAETQYQIKQGDTVYSIARQYNLSAQEVLRVNNISDPTEIGIGTSLVIPGVDASLLPATTAPPVTTAATARSHTVRKGDTYFNIAKRNDLSVAELLGINGRDVSGILRVGDVLQLTATHDTVVASASSAAPAAGATPPRSRVATIDGSNAWPHGGARSATQGKFPTVVISAGEGDMVRTVTGGRVVHIDSNGAFGKVVFVQASTGHIYIYGGNKETLVDIGERVTTGAFIGRVGARRVGANESQVYFSVWHDNNFVDPGSAPRG